MINANSGECYYTDNATRNFQKKDVLLNTKGQYMKESNTLADNAIGNLQVGEFLLYTKGKRMKESNTLADNAT